MKFSGIGVRCTELTGDTDWGTSSFKDLDEARLIVTTVSSTSPPPLFQTRVVCSGSLH